MITIMFTSSWDQCWSRPACVYGSDYLSFCNGAMIIVLPIPPGAGKWCRLMWLPIWNALTVASSMSAPISQGSSKVPARSWQSCTATVSVTLALLWIGLAITLTITNTARSAAAQNAAPQAAAEMVAAMAYWSVLKGSVTSGQLQHQYQ